MECCFGYLRCVLCCVLFEVAGRKGTRLQLGISARNMGVSEWGGGFSFDALRKSSLCRILSGQILGMFWSLLRSWNNLFSLSSSSIHWFWFFTRFTATIDVFKLSFKFSREASTFCKCSKFFEDFFQIFRHSSLSWFLSKKLKAPNFPDSRNKNRSKTKAFLSSWLLKPFRRFQNINF